MVGDDDVENVEELPAGYEFQDLDVISYFSQTVHHMGYIAIETKTKRPLFIHFWPDDGVQIAWADEHFAEIPQLYKVW